MWGLKMKKKKFISILLLLLSVFLFQAVSAHAISWGSNVKSALRKAKSKKKPVMVYFYTNWCSWCERLERETYSDLKVSKLARKFILVKVNGDRDRDTVEKYDIRGYPAVLFLGSKGNTIQQVEGYVGPDDFARIMQDVLKTIKPVSVKRSVRGKGGVLSLKERPKPPAVKEKEEQEKEEQEKAFKLSGIIYHLEKPKAIINDTVVKVGDEIDGAKVVEIAEMSVKLYYKNREIVLEME